MADWLDTKVHGQALRDFAFGQIIKHEEALDFNIPATEMAASGEWEFDGETYTWAKRDKAFILAQNEARSALAEALPYAEIAANAMILEITDRLPPQQDGALSARPHLNKNGYCVGPEYVTFGRGGAPRGMPAPWHRSMAEALTALHAEILQYAASTLGDILWWRYYPMHIKVAGPVMFGDTLPSYIASTRLVIGFEKDLKEQEDG